MKEFNFNSQVCTDKNQSERLLALGLKKETADMVHFFSRSLAQDWTIVPLAETETAKNIEGVEIPAWSLHRLLELNLLCCEQHFAFQFHITNIDNAYEYLINHTEWLIKEGYFNKEYIV